MKQGIHVWDWLQFINGVEVTPKMISNVIESLGIREIELLLKERPLELEFQRGVYDPPYPPHWLIWEPSGFWYDPDKIVSMKFKRVTPDLFTFYFREDDSILPFVT